MLKFINNIGDIQLNKVTQNIGIVL